MKSAMRAIFGPRVPEQDVIRGQYVAPAIFLLAGAIVLVTSFALPYWKMTLHAPQYPQGLHVQAYLDRLEGDVSEIDGLNHYIGMRPLNDAAQLERATSLMALGAMGLLLLTAVFIHNPWAAILSLPAILFPALFLIDLYFWLSLFGQNLDPGAALSSSIKPFTPPVLGEGKVGQFRTVAWAGSGLLMATAASGLVLIGLVLHRRAYKPLLDQEIERRRRSTVAPNGDENVLPGRRESAA